MDKESGICFNLWNSFLAGDKEAFARLYQLHVDALFRYGKKFGCDEDLIKDAIQEVFLDLYLKRKKNRTGYEHLRFYLLLAIKRNLIKKIQKQRKNSTNFERLVNFEPVYSIEKTMIEYEEEASLKRRIADLMKLLPSKQKEVLYLRFNESLEYPEIARLMDITVDSARKQVYRALSAIRQQYKKNDFLFFVVFQER